MKRPITFLFIMFIIFSCSEDSDQISESNEYSPLNYIPNYPQDLQLVKQTEEVRSLYKDLGGNPWYIKTDNEEINYTYNQNNTIDKINSYRTTKLYSINPDGTQGEQIPYNYTFDILSYRFETHFTYENDKISSIKTNRHELVTGSCYYEYEIIFSYDDSSKLKSYKLLFKDVSNHRDWVEEYEVTFEYEENKVFRERNFRGGSYNYKPTIILDNYGNYQKEIDYETGADTNTYVYDGMNNPNDLIIPKYLLGWDGNIGRFYLDCQYGRGNRIHNISNDESNYNQLHLYNQYDFPIETVFYSDSSSSDRSSNTTITINYEYNE